MEEKKERKTIKCSYAVLVIILFAALAFVTDYAFIERKISKCDCPKCEATNNEVISDNIDNTQVTEDNKSLVNRQDNLKRLEKIDYKSDNITNIDVKYNISDEFNNPMSQPIITAYNGDEVVWNYQFDGYLISQHSNFDLISVVDNELYLQYMGKISILNLDNGTITYNLEYNNEDYHIYSVFNVYEDLKNIYVVGSYGGSSCLNRFIIIDKTNKSINSILNTND